MSPFRSCAFADFSLPEVFLSKLCLFRIVLFLMWPFQTRPSLVCFCLKLSFSLSLLFRIVLRQMFSFSNFFSFRFFMSRTVLFQIGKSYCSDLSCSYVCFQRCSLSGTIIFRFCLFRVVRFQIVPFHNLFFCFIIPFQNCLFSGFPCSDLFFY